MHYEVQVRDWRGRGAEAEVSVAIVDKAVLALADDVGPDGLRAFWFQARAGRLYGLIARRFGGTRRNDIYSEAEEGGKGGDGGEYGLAGTYVRRDFQNTALWIGQLQTDEDGKASFELRLPDNATTWRAQARAVSGSTQVGEGGERAAGHAAPARAPRAAALPARRRRGRAAHARAQRDRGPSRRDGHDRGRGRHARGRNSTRSARIEPDVSAVFEWPARVLTHGTAKVLFRAYASGGYNDAVEISLPVHLDVTPETTATGGVVEDTLAVEAVYLPDYVITETGSLEISVQGSLVGALDDELGSFAPHPSVRARVERAHRQPCYRLPLQWSAARPGASAPAGRASSGPT